MRETRTKDLRPDADCRYARKLLSELEAAAVGQTDLVLLAPSLLIVVKDVVADVVFRLADKQPRSLPEAVASPTGGHGHSQHQQHCEEERQASVRLLSSHPEDEIQHRTDVKRSKLPNETFQFKKLHFFCHKSMFLLNISVFTITRYDHLRSRSATLAMTTMRAMKPRPTLEPNTAPAADLQSPEGSHRHTLMLT